MISTSPRPAGRPATRNSPSPAIVTVRGAPPGCTEASTDTRAGATASSFPLPSSTAAAVTFPFSTRTPSVPTAWPGASRNLAPDGPGPEPPPWPPVGGATWTARPPAEVSWASS